MVEPFRCDRAEGVATTVLLLQSNVLVLNRLWQAVNVVNARRALTLVYVGRGRVVDAEFSTHAWEDWLAAPAGLQSPDRIAGVNFTVPVPRVIQVLKFDRLPRPRVRFTRTNVYLRDRHQCQYCGCRGAADSLTLDHVLARSRGGRTTWANIVVSCVTCNARKRDLSPEEAGMRLLRQPCRPRWHPGTALRSVARPHPAWMPFLAAAPAAGLLVEAVP